MPDGKLTAEAARLAGYRVGVDMATGPDSHVVLLEVTPRVRELLSVVLDLAYEDQEHYLRYGDPEADYGEEWPDTAVNKAEGFCGIAKLAAACNLHGEPQRWYALAKAVADGFPGDRKAALLCECGRWPHDCKTLEDPTGEHGDLE